MKTTVVMDHGPAADGDWVVRAMLRLEGEANDVEITLARMTVRGVVTSSDGSIETRAIELPIHVLAEAAHGKRQAVAHGLVSDLKVLGAIVVAWFEERAASLTRRRQPQQPKYPTPSVTWDEYHDIGGPVSVLITPLKCMGCSDTPTVNTNIRGGKRKQFYREPQPHCAKCAAKLERELTGA